MNINIFSLDLKVVRVGASLKSSGSLFQLFAANPTKSCFSMFCIDSRKPESGNQSIQINRLVPDDLSGLGSLCSKSISVINFGPTPCGDL